MSNSYYNHGSYPTTGAPGTSASMRSELDSITSGFNLLPTISGNGNKAVVVNSGATALTVTTGTLALAGNFATTGAYNTTLIQGATTSLTLPLVSGTLATLAGTEEFTNKTLTSAVAKGTWTTSGTWTLPALTLGGAITYGGVTLSNAVTGTGNMVLSASPTLTGTIAAASQTLSGTLGVTGVATFTAQPILSSLTASKPVFTDASKGLTSTGTLAYDQGGTGLTSYTAGDIIYASGANTVAKLPIGTTGQRLVVAAGLPSWATDATIGTVTSVGWTGGIVSVATATTTPAFTIAGTSGGIPYFASGTTWATSAALAANALVLGGGAGAAPATTTTGTGVVTALGVNTGSAGAMVLFDGALGTPTSGTATNLTGLPLTTGVTGTLPVANGGTGLTAGTSGGVLAYTATGTLASSGLLAANALVLGGGAGAAPATTTTGTGVVTALGVNTGTAGAFVVNGGALGSPSSAGTIPAFTLGGTVAGGGNQLNNVIIGTTTPLAGAFTTLSATKTTAGNAAQFTYSGSLYKLNIYADPTGTVLADGNAADGQTIYFNTASNKIETYISNTKRTELSSTGLAVTGVLTSTLDATIYGVTVGRGGGAVSSNVAVGASALGGVSQSGGFNTAVGANTLLANTTAGNVSAFGYGALTGNTTGSLNSAFGVNALKTNSTGANNTGLGVEALQANTTASNSTAVGYQAGYTNTTGNVTAFGYQALNANTTAAYNTAVGIQASLSNTLGTEGTSVGWQALKSNTTGNYNTAMGGGALGLNVSGSNNTAIGRTSLANSTASDNTAVGFYSLALTTSGASNTAVGVSALQANTTASNNTAVGYQAGFSNTTGPRNTAIGWGSFYTNTTGGYNTAVGAYALRLSTTADSNTGIGDGALYANTTGAKNTALGASALESNTTASNNTAVGYQAAYANTTAQGTTAVGYQALQNNTTGTSNTAVGGGIPASVGSTLQSNTTGAYNSAFGMGALSSNTTASNNTAVGYQAGYAYTGTTGYNTFYGWQAGTAVTTGSVNTYIGPGAGNLMTSGAKNTILGAYNGNSFGLDIRTASNYIVLSDGDGNPRGVFDSSGNLGIGTTAPSALLDLQSSGTTQLEITSTGASGNMYVLSSRADGTFRIADDSAGQTRLTIDENGNVLVGTTSAFSGSGISPKVTISNTAGIGLIAIGNTDAGIVTQPAANTNYYPAFFLNSSSSGIGNISCTSSATAYNTSSDYRLKENVQPMTGALAKVFALKPVTFKWKSDGSDAEGFIAHELAEICPHAVTGEKDATAVQTYEISPAVPATFDEEGNELTAAVEAVMGEREVPRYQGIDTSFLVATLTAAIQEQQAIITALTTRITALEAK